MHNDDGNDLDLSPSSAFPCSQKYLALTSGPKCSPTPSPIGSEPVVADRDCRDSDDLSPSPTTAFPSSQRFLTPQAVSRTVLRSPESSASPVARRQRRRPGAEWFLSQNLHAGVHKCVTENDSDSGDGSPMPRPKRRCAVVVDSPATQQSASCSSRANVLNGEVKDSPVPRRRRALISPDVSPSPHKHVVLHADDEDDSPLFPRKRRLRAQVLESPASQQISRASRKGAPRARLDTPMRASSRWVDEDSDFEESANSARKRLCPVQRDPPMPKVRVIEVCVVCQIPLLKTIVFFLFFFFFLMLCEMPIFGRMKLSYSTSPRGLLCYIHRDD